MFSKARLLLVAVAIYLGLALAPVPVSTLSPMIASISFTTPAAARCRSDVGGECGRDAIFRPGEPRWAGNPRTYLDRNTYAPTYSGRGHGHGGGHMRGHGGGDNRMATTNRQSGRSVKMRSYERMTARKVGSFQVLVGQTVQRCMRNVNTGEIRC